MQIPFDYWLGLDKVDTNTWSWIGGAPMIYNKFAGSEPSGDGDCVEALLYFEFGWNDVSCNNLNIPICEKPANSPTPIPTTTVTFTLHNSSTLRISNLLNNQPADHKGYTVVVDALFDDKRGFHHFIPNSQDEIFVPVHPHRVVRISLYPVTNALDYNLPSVHHEQITGKAVNFHKPQNVLADGLTNTSIRVNWTEYDRFWNSDWMHYRVLWRSEKEATLDFQAADLSGLIFFNASHTLASEYTIADLQVFTEYTIRVETVNDFGTGPYVELTCRTGEGVPEKEPDVENISLVTPTSAKIQWKGFDITNEDDLHLLNSYDYEGYTMMISTLHAANVLSPTTITIKTTKGHVELQTTDLEFFALYKFDIAVQNAIGYSSFGESCFSLGEGVPSAAPSTLEKNEASDISLTLKVGEVPIANENGIVTHYNISYTCKDWSDDLHTINTTAIQHDADNVELWKQMLNVKVDCANFEITPNPQSSDNIFVVLTGLFPYTKYEVNASACTSIGCSDQQINAIFQTEGREPSCSPNITMTNTSSTSMFVEWQHLDYRCLHGRLEEYVLVIIESLNDINFTQSNIAYYESIPNAKIEANLTDEKVTVDSLKKYWNYTAVLFTENHIGFSSPSIATWAFTEEDTPDGPPTNVVMEAINSTAITIEMSVPVKELVNGIILGYEVSFSTFVDDKVSLNFTRKNKDENRTHVVIGGLRKFFDHNITIKAYTRIGLGVASEEVTVKTLEDVPTAPPAEYQVSLVSFDQIQMSWERIEYLETNGVMRRYNLSIQGILANESLHIVELTVEYDERLFTFFGNVSNLFPATIYNITIEGCTTPGCGPNATISQQTDEMAPSGIVNNISRDDVNATESLHFNWTDILPMEKRGVITHWNISLNKIKNPWDLFNDSTVYVRVPPNSFHYSFYNLDNYTGYTIGLADCTVVGCGPVKSVVYRTQTNIPSMAPYLVHANNLTSSSFRVWYEQLNDTYHEGILLGYSMLYREAEEHVICTTHNNCTAMNETFCAVNHTCYAGVSCTANISTCDVVDVGLNTNYTLWVAAVTSAGVGPLSDFIFVVTDVFVNGNWTAWTDWGMCTTSCGLGYHIRRRWCTNPVPQFGGEYCEGADFEKKPCNDFPCPAIYLAEPGVDCKEQCKLVDPSFICSTVMKTSNSKEVFESARDPSNYTLTFDIECEIDPATSDYSSVQHPSYDVDKKICSGFKNMPDRMNCSVNGVENVTLSENVRRLCNCIDKESMGYLQWAPWGECSKSCDVGYRQRFRNCIMDEIECDRTQHIGDCNVFQCPVHGQWGEWSEYGGCDRTCGFGIQKRIRPCSAPAPALGGNDCVGTDTEEIYGCNAYPCPIPGGWGEWEPKDVCSTPCGGGVLQKVRRCDDPEPLYNGTYCIGDAVNEEQCNENIPCKNVDVNFVVKLQDFEWDYTMVYDTTPTFHSVKTALNDALIAVLEDTAGTEHFLEMNIEKLSRGSVIANFTLTYTGAPFNEILVIQNAIDKVGYINGLRVQYMNVSSNDVPSLPPRFTAVSLTPYTINVTWEEVANTTTNGVPYTYYVFYRNIKGANKTWNNIGSNSFTALITHLEPGTLYGIRMLVAITGGNGVASHELDVETLEGVPFIAPPNLFHISIDYETLYLGWDPIPNDQVPGMLGGYEIRYRKYFGNVTTTLRVATDLLQRTIRGLKPNTWYWFEVGGFSSAGVGPLALVVFQTPPGPPGVPPPNVTKIDLYSTHSVSFTWDEIPPEEENGYMAGYKIRYQLMRRAGMDVNVGNPVKIVTFDRFVFAHTITGLEPYSEYKVEIYGYSSVGDGPANVSIASTCICPEKLCTNFMAVKPFTAVNKHNESIVEGLFPDLLNRIITKVCINCRYRSKLYYDRTLLGYPAEKIKMKDLRLTVGEGVHLNFPIFSKFNFERFEGTFPYIGIARSQGSAMIVVDPAMKTVGMWNILKAISNAWSVVLVAVLLALVCGWCFWFTEQSSEASDIDQTRALDGACQGAWLAYVTMTTVGYGDFVPTTVASKALMTVWVLVGLVTMGVVTGVISSGMTVGDMEEELMLYGTPTATIGGSYENQLAILRNAQIDDSMNYTKPLEILSAVKDGVVTVGLLDAVTASGYETEMLEMGLRVYKILDTNSGYGVVLSLGMEVAENDFKSYIISNAPLIDAFLKAQVAVLTPTPSRTESELISADEVSTMMEYMGIIFLVMCLLGMIKWWVTRRRSAVQPEEPKTADELAPVFMKMVEDFCDNFTGNLEKLRLKHEEDLTTLATLRKNYERLLVRTGFDKQVVLDTFEKKRKRDVYAIKKKNRHAYYEANL